MNFYYSEESTPLGFHKAFYKVLCPIFIAIHALLLFATIGHLTGNGEYYNSDSLVFTSFTSILSISFLFLISYGFAKRKTYAWYMVYAYSALAVLSNIISAVQSESAGTAVGMIIGSAIIPLLIGMYYYKRKPIFVPYKYDDQNTISVKDNLYQARPNYHNENPKTIATFTIESATKPSFCRKCGHKLVNGAAFCHKCGAKTS